MASSIDDELNLESLKQLKHVFEAADDEGVGELDMDRFCQRLGPHLGSTLSRQQVAQLFMKIDADAGGTVDWNEFTSYMFLEKAQASASENDNSSWRLLPQEFPDKHEASCYHHAQVDRVFALPSVDKYITCSRDGTFKLWNSGDMKHLKTVNNGHSWIVDCVHMPLSRKIVFTTMDRAISYYDTHRGAYDLVGRVYASGSMGVPMALSVLSGGSGERVVYGDTKGAVVLLLCGSRELPARDLISTDEHKDYIYLHQQHSDWITQLQWIPEIGLVSSSLDSTIKTFDIARERISHTCTHHAKGVHGFVWCRAYSCFASCSLERDIIVWQGTTGRKVGELRGHTSSVTALALDERSNHLFSLSADRTVKMWDLRTHRCLQTITESDWHRAEDNKPTSFLYDTSRRRLVTAVHRPYVWHHVLVSQDRTGHREPLCGALYNTTFGVVVSVDEGGTVCVWNMLDGSREGRFSRAHGTSKVTAISFDKKHRRLLTAGNDGSVKLWNFNNGSLLRSFTHDLEQLEICTVLMERDDKRSQDVVYAAGWNCKVFAWEDVDHEVVSNYRLYDGHKEDVLCMAAHPGKMLLATGDYEGRIYIWNMFSGERKAWMCHRGERFETSVEQLLWLPAFSQVQRSRQKQAAEQLAEEASRLAEDTEPAADASTASLSTGKPAQQSSASEVPRAEHSGRPGVAAAAAGDVQPQSSSSRAAAAGQCSTSSTTAAAAAAPPPGVQPSSSSSAFLGGSPEPSTSQLEVDPSAAEDDPGTVWRNIQKSPAALLLLSAGGDGFIRVWRINGMGSGSLLCTLPGAHGSSELVSALCADQEFKKVAVGDTCGHIRVFDISLGVETSHNAACTSSFKQAAHWLAHDGGVASLDMIPGKQLVLSAGKDCNVTVWTLSGGLLGTFGEHTWTLEDPTTWADPTGEQQRQPLPLKKYASAADEVGQPAEELPRKGDMRRGSQPGVGDLVAMAHARSTGGVKAKTKQPRSSVLFQDTSGSTLDAGNSSTAEGEGWAGWLSSQGGPGQPRQTRQHASSLLAAYPELRSLVDDSAASTPAQTIIQDCKKRYDDMVTTVPRQPHCQLQIHNPEDVSRTVDELLKTAAERRRNKARSMNTTTSSNSIISSSKSTHLSLQAYGRPQLFNWRSKGQL